MQKTKSVDNAPSQGNNQIRQCTIYYAGLLGQWYKRIIDQESDVPSKYHFFFTFYRLRALKTLYFLFFYFRKKIR